MRAAVNQDLVGVPGGATRLETPALVLDLPAFRANLDRMADLARGRARIRPHAKTHKSRDVAAEQARRGAVGQCCAKLGEAEALAGGEGCRDLLVTSPVVTERGRARLVQLAARLDRLGIVADDPDDIAALGAAARAAGVTLDLYIDLDVGQHRTGCFPEEAEALARLAAATEGLRLAGLQAYAGHAQHLHDPAARRAELARVAGIVTSLKARLGQAGFTDLIATGGGTGSAVEDLELGAFDELQLGSYAVMDRQYREAGAGFATALTVWTRIVGLNQKIAAIVDAGAKALAPDAPGPRFLAPFEAAPYLGMGDEHGALLLADPGPLDLRTEAGRLAASARITALNADPSVPRAGRHAGLRLGDLLRLEVPHCDPTINLHDWYHGVDGDTLVALWPITARGASA